MTEGGESVVDVLSDIAEALSIMADDSSTPLTERIALRVRKLRAAKGLSLDELAGRCGVGRSMLSLIERGESSPTAALLEKAGLGAERVAGRAVRGNADQPRAGVATWHHNPTRKPARYAVVLCSEAGPWR